MDRTRVFLIIWTAVLFIAYMNNNQGPKVVTPDQQSLLDSVSPAKGPLSTGEPITLANENLKVKIDADGSLVSALVLRYNEDIVEHKIVPDEVVKALQA